MKMKYMLLLGIAAATTAQADTETFSQTVSLQSTDWNAVFNLPKWNGSLGTLTGVGFSLFGEVQGQAGAESLDALPSTVTLALKADIKLEDPSNNIIVETIPVVSVSKNLSAYDGVTDFGGSSGFSTGPISATDTETVAPSPAYISLFSGTGTIALPLSAQGVSQGSGSGNLIAFFQTNASATATVTYYYTSSSVPGPAGPVSFAVAGIGVFARRRRRNA